MVVVVVEVVAMFEGDGMGSEGGGGVTGRSREV